MKIIHFNPYDIVGGAARAAYRIHRSIVDYGEEQELSSTMRVFNKRTSDGTVEPGRIRGWDRLPHRLTLAWAEYRNREFSSGNTILHSTARRTSGLGEELSNSNADIIHLHWIGQWEKQVPTLSIEEIGKLRRPLVWTLHDQWAYCGAEHYVTLPPTEDERFATGYKRGNRPTHESGPDINRQTWQRKLSSWKRPIHIVCPSRWMADCASRSVVMKDWPICVIPNPIDLSFWSPVIKCDARKRLGLHAEKRLILFGSDAATKDKRKGGDLLLEALQLLHEQVAGMPTCEFELIVLGQASSPIKDTTNFPVHYTGYIDNDETLKLWYSAVDVMAIPSRQDNLPNTGLEAHACGTPVVGFETGGLPDIVEHQRTGALADPFNSGSLAACICWILEDQQRLESLGRCARERAEKLWDPAKIAKQYSCIYQDAYHVQQKTKIDE